MVKRIYSDKPKYLNQVGKEVYIMKRKWKMVRVDEETHHKLLLAKLKSDKAITKITREAITEYLSKLGIFMLLLFFIPFVSAFECNGIPDDYNYILPLTIENQENEEVNAYQIQIMIDTITPILNGKMNSDCSDIRVLDLDGNLIPYWIENCSSVETKMWIKVDLQPLEEKNICLIYGNPTATSLSSIDDVFEGEINGLLGAWLMDEGSGNTLYDSSGNEHHHRQEL